MEANPKAVNRNTFLSPSECPQLFFLVTCPSLRASRSSRNPPSFQTQFWKQHFGHIQSSISEGWLRAFAPESDLNLCVHPAKPRAWLGNATPWADWEKSKSQKFQLYDLVMPRGSSLGQKSCWSRQLLKKKKGKEKKTTQTNQTCCLSDC